MATQQQKKDSNDFGFYALLGICVLLAYLCLTSCMTNRKGELTTKGKNFIATHCRGFDSVATNHEVIFKDTTIYLTQKGETIYLQNPCDSVAPIVKVKNGIKSTVLSIGKTKVFICEADSLRAVIKLLERKSTIRKVERAVIEKPCSLDHIGRLQSFWIVTGMGLLGFILFQILIRIITSAYPITKPFLGWAYLFRF